ncbi:putative F-box domain-containing protein [Rosa chinensis]|uniref:Putative F-box domain-containing protein n=1 Tax=Rosa chinensis TaxID=74649 RepID=A0A2P6RKG0_ROSCH|nr:putative F-box domain-containing protein [Rosa chinensis]
MASSQTLPSDLYFEILTRASFDTVGRCRLVSKQWNHLTYDSSFINQLSQRTKTTHGVFIQSSISSNYISTFVQAVGNNDVSNSEQLSLNFLPQPVKIEAAHQGILVCVSQKRVPQYYVCKPTTREWEQIHNPKTRYMTVKIALMVLRSSPLRYKIVRFSEPKSPYSKYKSQEHCYNLRCEVYDSKARAWKQLNNVALPKDAYILRFQPAVSACGALHWLLSDNRVGIFAFHVDEENWEIFAPPCLAVDNVNGNQVVEYQGRLAWICEVEDSMELWVMEDYKNKVWSKRQILRIKGLDRLASFATLCNNDVALMRGFFKIIFYKFGDYSSKIANLEEISRPDEIFMLQSDSEPTRLKGPLKSWVIIRWFRSIKKKWSPITKYRLRTVGKFCSTYGTYAIEFVFLFLALRTQLIQRLTHYLYGVTHVLQTVLEYLLAGA